MIFIANITVSFATSKSDYKFNEHFQRLVIADNVDEAIKKANEWAKKGSFFDNEFDWRMEYSIMSVASYVQAPIE